MEFNIVMTTRFHFTGKPKDSQVITLRSRRRSLAISTLEMPHPILSLAVPPAVRGCDETKLLF
jgi:hypothetical protein